MRERYLPYRALMAEVAQVRAQLDDRIAALDDSIAAVEGFDAQVRADPRFTGDLRTAALIVVGEVDASRQAIRAEKAKQETPKQETPKQETPKQ